MSDIRRDAELIWRTAVDAVRPQPVVRAALQEPSLSGMLHAARRIVVVGAGKAGAAMAAAVEQGIPQLLDRVTGVVNVPAELVRPLKAIRLHPARPAGHNHPTAEGVAGAEQILQLVASTAPDDVVLCLLSGGGSALLPLPSSGITLADKQAVTQLLHACGATIDEMNAVRKHLSRIKGGRLAEAFHGKALGSLIISDVIGDPLDVIASGPTVPDPTTFADAFVVLQRYGLTQRVPSAVLAHLQAGVSGLTPETPKLLPANISQRILANNAMALAAASAKATQLGYHVVNLDNGIDGETQRAAEVIVEIVRGLPRAQQPFCFLSGGETTVRLGADHGLGGRNQEFVLAAALKLGIDDLRHMVILSGGTDGEDGPTDAAGAFADSGTLERAAALGLDAANYLTRHDAYHFFAATGDLFKPGLTETNVMDVRVLLTARTAGPVEC